MILFPDGHNADAYEAWIAYGIRTGTKTMGGWGLADGAAIQVPTLWPMEHDPSSFPPDDVDSSHSKADKNHLRRPPLPPSERRR